jgi:hypothetical protein
MDKEFEEILNKTASYVEESQTEIGNLRAALEKNAAEKQAFNVQAQRTAAVLADRGLLEPGKVNDFVDKIASSPLKVLETLEKMAKTVEVSSLGGPTSIKVASGQPVDPFVAEFFPELVQSSSSGMVD